MLITGGIVSRGNQDRTEHEPSAPRRGLQRIPRSGAVQAKAGPPRTQRGRSSRIEATAVNTGDRPSPDRFALPFLRGQQGARFRPRRRVHVAGLDHSARHAVRFEPGASKEVRWSSRRQRELTGLNNLTDGIAFRSARPRLGRAGVGPKERDSVRAYEMTESGQRFPSRQSGTRLRGDHD